MKLYSRKSYLDLSYPHVMGILNITPDSFYDGGRNNTLTKALTHANEMISAGATIIDIGGESTRPGAEEVSTEQELERVIPIVEAIAKRFEVWISVDTSKPDVIRESARSGAHIINDVRSLRLPNALEAAAETDLLICLTHMQGQPKTMQVSPHYDNLLKEIKNFFIQRIACCEAIGIKKSKLLLDPGFGFGKNLNHNYQLLAHLDYFHYFGLPLLVGMSRKSMIGQLLNIEPSQRLIGSLACEVIAAMHGVQIIRTHDVRESMEAMRVVKAVRSVME